MRGGLRGDAARLPAKIFVPTSPRPPSRADPSYGADLVVGGERYADALAASERWVASSGAMPVHAYDQPETLLGAGTVGAEIEEQAPHLDTLLVAVGGGGLIGGIAAWYGRQIGPRSSVSSRNRRRRSHGRSRQDARSTPRRAASLPIRWRRGELAS